jgi:hypothetical protein
MSFIEFIKKKPLTLVFAFVILIGFLVLAITPQNLQLLVPILSYSIFGLAIVFSAVVTYMTYTKYERPFDVLIIPLFVSIVFICFTAILMVLTFLLDSTSMSQMSLDLGIVSFPLALFGVGVSLYYFVDAQFSSDKKLDEILTEIKGLQYANKESLLSEQNKIEIPTCNKDYSTLTDEDQIVFQHLFDRHKNLLSYVDAVDTKFAQIIALNGIILSFIIFAAPNAKHFNIFIFGIMFIIISMIIGAIGYYTRNFYPGAAVTFFEDYDTFSRGVGIIKLKKQLILDIQRNETRLERKANIFNIMLPLVILGLIVILVGYYA